MGSGHDGVLMLGNRSLGPIEGPQIALGRFSGSGGWDLAAVGQDSRLRWTAGFRGMLDMRSRELGFFAEEIVAADFDGDGRDELVLSAYEAGKLAVVEDPAGEARVRTLGFSGPGRLAAGDLDGDGRPEIVMSDDNGDVIRFSDEPRFLGNLVLGIAPRAPVALGDLDGDGVIDLVTADGSRGELAVRLGLGGGKLGEPRTWSAGGAVQSLAIADLDGDGQNEILVGALANLVVLHRE
jgi:hypothetical protein